MAGGNRVNSDNTGGGSNDDGGGNHRDPSDCWQSHNRQDPLQRLQPKPPQDPPIARGARPSHRWSCNSCSRRRKTPGRTQPTSEGFWISWNWFSSHPVKRNVITDYSIFHHRISGHAGNSDDFQPGQILRIDQTDRPAVPTQHHDIIHPVLTQSFQDFHGQSIVPHGNRPAGHQRGHGFPT